MDSAALYSQALQRRLKLFQAEQTVENIHSLISYARVT